jgi:hypothetical protein
MLVKLVNAKGGEIAVEKKDPSNRSCFDDLNVRDRFFVTFLFSSLLP